MTTSRSTGSRNSVVVLALAAVLVASAGGTALAGRHRVVILEFHGPNADKFHADVVKLVRKGNTVVGIEKWDSTAEDLGATKINSKNVKKVARKLNVDGVIVGEVEKRRERYILRIKVREGRSGDYTGNPIEATSGEGRLDAHATKDLKGELLDTIDTLDPAVSSDDDEDSDGDVRDRGRDEDEDRASDRDEDEDRGSHSKARGKGHEDEDRAIDRDEDEDRGSRSKARGKGHDADADRDADADADGDRTSRTKSGFGGKDRDDRRGRDKVDGAGDDRGDPRTSDGDDGENPLGSGTKGHDKDRGPRMTGKDRGKDAGASGKDRGTDVDDVDRDAGSADRGDSGDDRGEDRGEDGDRGKDGDGNDRVASRDGDGGDDGGDDDGNHVRDHGDDEVDDGIDHSTPGNRAVDAVVGVSFTQRKLSFQYQADLVDRPQGYKGAPVAGLYLDADIYPLALNKKNRSVTRNIGLTVLADRVLKISTHVAAPDGMTISLPTKQWHYAIGVVFRAPLGSAVFTAHLRYGKMGFSINKTGAPMGTTVDVPDLAYTVVDPGVGIVYPIGKLALGLEGSFMAITSTGQLQSNAQYGAATVTGIDAEAHVDYLITSKIFARAAFHLMTVGFKFKGTGDLTNNRDADPEQDVFGARDTYLGGYLTAGYLF